MMSAPVALGAVSEVEVEDGDSRDAYRVDSVAGGGRLSRRGSDSVKPWPAVGLRLLKKVGIEVGCPPVPAKVS